MDVEFGNRLQKRLWVPTVPTVSIVKLYPGGFIYAGKTMHFEEATLEWLIRSIGKVHNEQQQMRRTQYTGKCDDVNSILVIGTEAISGPIKY
jgi:hypothetical protein